MAGVQRQHRCDCNRRFATINALAQHKRDSPRHPTGQDQANTPKSVHPTPVSTNNVASTSTVTASAAAASAEPTVLANTNSTPAAAGQSTSATAEKKKKKTKKPKNKKKDGKPGATTRPSYSYASSASSDDYIMRRGYNPGWEYEYEMGGPDHTQCSPDCDWCGVCAYREPY